MLQGIQSYDCPWGEIFNVSFDKFMEFPFFLHKVNNIN